MAEQTSLNYSELKKIAKNFDDESEVLAELLSRTRQMVHDLQDDWMGDAGERFFDEMESEILPAMERLTQALSFTAGTVRKIVKTFDDAEFETVEFFSDGRLERSNAGAELSGLDFGIGGAVDAPSQGIGVGDLDFGIGGAVDAPSQGIGVGDLDFGIGGAVDAPSPGIEVGDLDFGIGGAVDAPSQGIGVGDLDFGIGGAVDAPSPGIEVGDLDFGKDALGDVPVDAGGPAPGGGETSGPVSPGDAANEKVDTASESSTSESSTGGGGGGGGSGGSEGLQGDLNGMGTGTSHQSQNTGAAEAGGAASDGMADHVYRSQTPDVAGGATAAAAGGSAATPATNAPQPAVRPSGGDASGADSNNLAGIAGALGGLGAAAGGVAKVVKDKKESE